MAKNLSMTPAAIALRKWRAENPGANAAACARWQKKNPAKATANVRRWQLANPERYKAQHTRAIARYKARAAGGAQMTFAGLSKRASGQPAHGGKP